MKLYMKGFAMILILALTACNGDQSSTMTDAKNGAGSTAKTKTTAVREESVGSVAFAVDGVERSLEYMPKSDSYYTKAASQFHAYRAIGAKEKFFVTFMAIDLKKQTFPVGLPLPRDPKNPNLMAAMAAVGFGYINAEGAEWAGPGKIRVESMDNGVLQGSFDQVSLPHTDQELQAITLTGGTFRARIDD